MRDENLECRLGDLISITSGNAFRKSEYSENGVPLFQIANVSFNKTSWDKVAYLPHSYLDDTKYEHLILNQDDIVMALNRPMLDMRLKISQLSQADVPAILYQRVGKLNIKKALFPKYLLYFLQSPIFIKWLADELQGVNIPFINQSKLLAYNSLSFFPLPEQRAIVSKIEALFSDLDQGINDLKKAQEQLKVYRQAVLKKAFEGTLERTILRDCGEWKGGGTPSSSVKEYWENGKIPWVSSRDVKTKEIHDTERHITEIAIPNSSTKWIEKDSLLVRYAKRYPT